MARIIAAAEIEVWRASYESGLTVRQIAARYKASWETVRKYTCNGATPRALVPPKVKQKRADETHPCQACGKGIAHPAGKGRKPKFCDSKCRYAVHKGDVKADRESTRSKPCKRPGCHGLTAQGAKFCSPECARQHRAAPVRLCPECGKVNPRRSSWATCSDDCARSRKMKADDAMRVRATKSCAVCGIEMHGAPSTLASRKVCGAACLRAWREANTQPKKPHPCIVCGNPCVGRKTCGHECFVEMNRRRSTVGARSEQVRAKRRKHRANAYRGKDKPEVIERLTKQQRGRCKVCGGEGTLRGDGTVGLVLDHDHTTGLPRAMLCGPCNAALGLLGESPERVRSLWDYARSCRAEGGMM